MTPTYVIACDELPKRKSQCVRHLRQRGVDFTVFRSFHGESWGLRTTREYDPGRTISPGHVGLNLGHYALWLHLHHTLPDRDSTAIVYEDDVDLPEDWEAQYADVISQMDRDIPEWQFCFLGLCESAPQCWHKVTERIGRGDSRLCRLVDPFGTHAYILRKSALTPLLQHMAVAERNMDQQLFQRVLKPGYVKWCGVLPTIVKQRTFDYTGTSRPEWAPSCIDPDPAEARPSSETAPRNDDRFVSRGNTTPYALDEQDAKRLSGAEMESRATPEVVAASSALIDPYACFYKGEFLEEDGTDPKGRTVPLSQCGRFAEPCHARRGTWVTLGRAATLACESCSHRTGIAGHVGTTDRPRLDLPEGHFNPSHCMYRGRLIFATRDSWGHSRVALWEATNDRSDWSGEWKFTPISSLASAHREAPRLEDPRLFVMPDADGEPCLCSMFNLPDGYPPKRVQVGYVRFSRDLDCIEETVVYPSPVGNAYEKNWQPVYAADGLVWVYSDKPTHLVVGEADNWQTPNPLPWTGGVVRGGAAPILVNNPGTGRLEYWSFYHGCLKRFMGNIYSVGCLAFEAEPPYRVLRQTPTPLIWPDLPGPTESVVKRMVVWPGGAVRHGDRIHLALGVDDTYCRIQSLSVAEVHAAMQSAPESAAQRTTSIRDTPIALGIKARERV